MGAFPAGLRWLSACPLVSSSAPHRPRPPEAGLRSGASSPSTARGFPGSPGRALVGSQHFANTANVEHFYRDCEDHSLFLLTLAL